MISEIKDFLAANAIPYEENVNMSKMTTFRIGGIAPLVVYPEEINQVSQFVRFMHAQQFPYHLIGNGSNILLRDDLSDKVFVKLSKMNTIELNGENLTAGAGCLNVTLANFALEHALTGYEFAHGIPGSLGGAVAMNAGAYGHTFDEVLQKVFFVDNCGLVRTYSKNAEDFGYRKSPFANESAVVCGAEIRLKHGSKTDIRATMDELIKKRRTSQPLDLPSAGSVFKRPTGFFAGKLIEDAGLKGYTIGGAQVSEKHAGFIVNIGGATAQDVLDLIEHIQKTVYEQKGVHMYTEVKVI